MKTRTFALALVVVLCMSITSPVVALSTNWGRADAVLLNEVACHSSTGEFVEIINVDTLHPIDVSGWMISQVGLSKVDATNSYVLPARTFLGAGATVSFSAGANRTLPFSIGCAKDSIRLWRKSNVTWQLQDSVAVPNLTVTATWGRNPNDFSHWIATTPSPGATNAPVVSGSVYDRAAFLFDPLKEATVNLTIPADSATALAQEGMNSHAAYVKAYFQVVTSDGILIPDVPIEVGIRVKGSVGSWVQYTETSKTALKINFDPHKVGQRFVGLKKMTLNNMNQDPAGVAETMTYRLFRAFGVDAPRTGFARVNINGIYRGLYLNLEQYDSVSLAWHYSAIEHLYEGQHDGNVDPSTPDLLLPSPQTKFHPDEGSITDLSDLVALVKELKDKQSDMQQLTGSGQRDHIMPSDINTQEVATMMAIEKYVNHWDGYAGTPWWTPNNHFLLHSASGTWEILPWGADQTWTPWMLEEFWMTTNASLFKFCMVDITCYQIYVETLASIPSKVAELGISDDFDTVFAAHRDSFAAETSPLSDMPTREWALSVKKEFIISRRNDVTNYIAGRMTPEILWQPKANTLIHGVPVTSEYLNAVGSVPGTITYSISLGSRPRAGTLIVTAHLQPDDNRFAVVNKSVTFSVRDFQVITVQTLKAHKLAKKSSLNTFSISFSASSKLVVVARSQTPKICSISRKTIRLKSKGTCSLSFTQVGNATYFPATQVIRKFRVA